jgi:pimeloyl-ACP methyl ester carboxylesterase
MSSAGNTRRNPPPLNPKERHHRIAGPIDGLTLFLRLLPRARPPGAPRIVLYVHGGTFPSALSIAHRFDGRSWRDELTDAGFDVWGLDFHGFGASDAFPEMVVPAERNPVLGSAESASRQLEHSFASSAIITGASAFRSSRIPGARSRPDDLPDVVPNWSSASSSSDGPMTITKPRSKSASCSG